MKSLFLYLYSVILGQSPFGTPSSTTVSIFGFGMPTSALSPVRKHERGQVLIHHSFLLLMFFLCGGVMFDGLVDMVTLFPVSGALAVVSGCLGYILIFTSIRPPIQERFQDEEHFQILSPITVAYIILGILPNVVINVIHAHGLLSVSAIYFLSSFPVLSLLHFERVDIRKTLEGKSSESMLRNGHLIESGVQVRMLLSVVLLLMIAFSNTTEMAKIIYHFLTDDKADQDGVKKDGVNQNDPADSPAKDH